MARVKRGSGKAEKVSNDIITFIKKNRANLSTNVGYGGNAVSVEGDILTGGHFKLRSAMRQAGLTIAEQDKALA